MPKQYCSEFVISNRKYHPKCKNSVTFNFPKGNYCWIHANKLFKKYAVNIQKIYRAYNIHKTLKNIYYNLPRDIQKNILYFVREQYYTKKYNTSIIKILVNKLGNFKEYQYNLQHEYIALDIYGINYINQMYTLLNK